MLCAREWEHNLWYDDDQKNDWNIFFLYHLPNQASELLDLLARRGI